ncbi:MAG: M1 family aminopeptidase [Bacteroidales bacterium]
MDNVTCATWSDIWVNEGFASYGQYIARSILISEANANSLMNSYHNTAMSIPDGSVYVSVEDLSSSGRIFETRLTHEKVQPCI